MRTRIRPPFELVMCVLVLVPATLFAFPSVYPTGTTIYKPDKAWNGYTIHPNPPGAILIDMNGNVVKQWKGLAERVLVTKREWGRKTLGVDELARVHVYRDATGGLVVVKWPQNQ